MTRQLAPRRQARFLPDRVILPEAFEAGRWYDVCTGRRRDDHRPGFVLLEVGPHRTSVPAAVLEFRVVPAAPPAGVGRRSGPGASRWSRGLRVAAVSALPLGVLAAVALIRSTR